MQGSGEILEGMYIFNIISVALPYRHGGGLATGELNESFKYLRSYHHNYITIRRFWKHLQSSCEFSERIQQIAAKERQNLFWISYSGCLIKQFGREKIPDLF